MKSYIAKMEDDGGGRSIFLEVSNEFRTATILNTHYKNEETLNELLDLGDLRYLGQTFDNSHCDEDTKRHEKTTPFFDEDEDDYGAYEDCLAVEFIGGLRALENFTNRIAKKTSGDRAMFVHTSIGWLYMIAANSEDRYRSKPVEEVAKSWAMIEVILQLDEPVVLAEKEEPVKSKKFVGKRKYRNELYRLIDKASSPIGWLRSDKSHILHHYERFLKDLDKESLVKVIESINEIEKHLDAASDTLSAIGDYVYNHEVI